MSKQDRISTESESADLNDAITVRVNDPDLIRQLVRDGVIDPVIPTNVAAELIGVSYGHLRNLRMKGIGPVRYRHAHSSQSYGYRLSEVQAYIDSMEPDTAAGAGSESKGGDAA